MFAIKIMLSALVIVTLVNRYACADCKEAEKKCLKLEKLHSELDMMATWGGKKCANKNVTFGAKEVEMYKNCVKTHLIPCVSHHKVLTKLANDLMTKYDLAHVCNTHIRDEIEEHLMDVYHENTAEFESENQQLCSVLRQAIHNVITCANIK